MRRSKPMTDKEQAERQLVDSRFALEMLKQQHNLQRANADLATLHYWEDEENALLHSVDAAQHDIDVLNREEQTRG
jgi:hypothetical protein